MMNEEKIKTRLIGSIIVVLAVVVLVPIFLENKAVDPKESEMKEVPPKEKHSPKNVLEWDGSQDALKNQIDSVLESSSVTKSEKEGQGPAFNGSVENPSTNIEEASESDSDFEDSLKKLESSIESRLRKESTSEEGSQPATDWVVQVGSFSSEENANQLILKLNEQAFDAFVIEREKDQSESFRVRVGPFDKKNEALKALSLIKEKFGLVGFLVKIRP